MWSVEREAPDVRVLGRRSLVRVWPRPHGGAARLEVVWQSLSDNRRAAGGDPSVADAIRRRSADVSRFRHRVGGVCGEGGRAAGAWAIDADGDEVAGNLKLSDPARRVLHSCRRSARTRMVRWGLSCSGSVIRALQDVVGSPGGRLRRGGKDEVCSFLGPSSLRRGVRRGDSGASLGGWASNGPDSRCGALHPS